MKFMIDYYPLAVLKCPAMKVATRQNRILHELAEKGYVSVRELSRGLAVSEMTVRRDLEAMGEAGLLVRQHGGASYDLAGGHPELPFFFRHMHHLREKKAIGRAAAAMIQQNSSLILDAGTTTLEVARHLNVSNLMVVSNSLPALQCLAARKDMRLYCPGGEFLHDNQCFIGAETVEYLKRIHGTTAILAATGLCFEKGLTNHYKNESAVKQAMIEAADHVILAMDSSKIGQRAFSWICHLDAIDVLVTDRGLKDEDRKHFDEQGVQVVIAPDIDEPR